MAPTFNAIGMAVADMAATLAFYRRLGLSFPAGSESEPHVEAELPGGLRLMFDTYETIRSFDPDFTPPTGAGASLAFLCADPAEVDRVYADVTGAGYTGHKEPWDAFWGQRYACVQDPDGNGIDLFAPLKPEA
jgi:catechol 2,3-dioxygenase-like lactoylglutathione lyase family enzyme